MNPDERAYRTFQALILGGLGIFLLSIIGDGRILLYINQRFVLLIVACAIGFLFLAQAVLKARPALLQGDTREAPPGREFPRGALWLLALPLMVALLVPQRPLGASAAAVRGVRAGTTQNLNVGQDALALAVPAQERNVLEWMNVFSASPDLSVLDGQPVDVTGFVYRDGRMGSGQFVITRFSVTCCVADAAAVGLEVDWDAVAQPADNSWVRVSGVLRIEREGQRLIPRVAADTVDSVLAPEQPYLFR